MVLVGEGKNEDGHEIKPEAEPATLTDSAEKTKAVGGEGGMETEVEEDSEAEVRHAFVSFARCLCLDLSVLLCPEDR